MKIEAVVSWRFSVLVKEYNEGAAGGIPHMLMAC